MDPSKPQILTIILIVTFFFFESTMNLLEKAKLKEAITFILSNKLAFWFLMTSTMNLDLDLDLNRSHKITSIENHNRSHN